MQNNYLRKGLTISLILMLVGIIPSISAKISPSTFFETIKNHPLNNDVIFSDDFNDNSKDSEKWTEIFTGGEWFERNYQTEFRKYEVASSSTEGIESKGIPVTIKNVPLITECIMDTFIDNWPDQFYQWIGQPHIRVIDADDPDNHFIDVHYRRDYDIIKVLDSSGTDITLATINEFRSKVVITINKNGYSVDVGSYSSGFIPEPIFSEKFTVKLKLYIYLNGDYSNYWWIAGFDDVIITGKRSDPRNVNNYYIVENNMPKNICLLEKLIMKIFENKPFLKKLIGLF